MPPAPLLLLRIGKISCFFIEGLPRWSRAVECGFYGKNGLKEMEFLAEKQGTPHTASCLAGQTESHNPGPGERSGGRSWAEAPSTMSSFGILARNGKSRVVKAVFFW